MQGSKRDLAASVPSFEPILGRLDCAQRGSEVSRGECAVSGQTSGDLGVFSQSGQIGVSTKTGFHFSGLPLFSERGDSKTHRGPLVENPKSFTAIYQGTRCEGKGVAISARTAGGHRENGSIRYAEDEIATEVLGSELVAEDGLSRSYDYGVARSDTLVQVVGRERQCHGRGASPSGPAAGACVHGRFTGRVGGTSRGYNFNSQGQVVGRGQEVTYQSVGAEGNLARAEALRVPAGGFVSVDSVRQLDSRSLYQQARGDEIVNSASFDSGGVRVGSGTADYAAGTAYSGSAQCDSRRFVQGASSSANGMGFVGRGDSDALEGMGSSTHRHVCHALQQQATCVCVACAGREGLGSRCILHQVGSDVPLCLSSNRDFIEGTAENRRINRDYSSINRTSMVQAKLVPNVARVVSGSTASATGVEEAAETATVGNVPLGPFSISASRLATLQSAHEKKGFSAGAAERMSRGQKESTLLVYEGKWKAFGAWCSGRGLDPVQASLANIADFLCYLKEVKGLCLSTIEGYRTAIAGTLRVTTGLEVGKDPSISSLLANFAREVSKKDRTAPAWDLAYVLDALRGKDFEPLEEASLKCLTLKTVFLVALASGRRRGELHALRPDVRRTENWSEVTIDTDINFVAKTELATGAGMKPLTIKSLDGFLGPDMENEKQLCPVRALRIYLNRTSELREGKKCLFISYKKSFIKDVAKNTISQWIRKAILYAYRNWSAERCRVLGVKAHDVRALAASWAAYSNASTESIMGACSWKSNNTFTSFYLRDLSRVREDMYCLGPVVAALHIA